MLGLQKAHSPQIHKNILSVNAKLKEVKPLIHVQTLKLPQGLPTEQTMPQGHWGVGRAVASEAYGAGSEVLTPHSFSSQMHLRRKPFSLKCIFIQSKKKTQK